MDQSPYWEANRFSASQEIPHILGNPKVYYRKQYLLMLIVTASQINRCQNKTVF